MFTSRDLKAVITEVRPIVERQLDDATSIASFREKVTAQGGDWSQVKALVKAIIQDERDEAGGHKRVLAILHKADHALGYADMLGLGNLNEKNSFADHSSDLRSMVPAHDPITGEIADDEAAGELVTPGPDAADHGTDVAGGGAADLSPGGDDVDTPPAHAPEQPGTDHGSVSTPDEGGAHSSNIRQPAAPIPQALAGAADTASGDSVDPSAVPAVPASNVTPIHRFNPATHFANSKGLPRLHGCTRPEACGGSHRALCFICSTQHDGPAYQDGAA